MPRQVQQEAIAIAGVPDSAMVVADQLCKGLGYAGGIKWTLLIIDHPPAWQKQKITTKRSGMMK